MKLQAWQRRVVDEKKALAMKVIDLQTFMSMDIEKFMGLSKEERGRLQKQRVYMHAYLNILDQRIDAWFDDDEDDMGGDTPDEDMNQMDAQERD